MIVHAMTSAMQYGNYTLVIYLGLSSLGPHTAPAPGVDSACIWLLSLVRKLSTHVEVKVSFIKFIGYVMNSVRIPKYLRIESRKKVDQSWNH